MGRPTSGVERLVCPVRTDKHVKWVPPMPRLVMQRMMANVDVVWDQFGLDAFGALVLRTLEQGTPLISSGISDSASRLIGAQTPWIAAATTDEIVSAVVDLHNNMKLDGRDTVLRKTSERYRKWLGNYH